MTSKEKKESTTGVLQWATLPARILWLTTNDWAVQAVDVATNIEVAYYDILPSASARPRPWPSTRGRLFSRPRTCDSSISSGNLELHYSQCWCCFFSSLDGCCSRSWCCYILNFYSLVPGCPDFGWQIFFDSSDLFDTSN